MEEKLSDWGEMPVSDLMYEQAVEIVMQNKRASISLVRRHLGIGYNRSALLLEQMEKNGLVGAMSANGNRDILISRFAEGAQRSEHMLDAEDPYGRVFCNRMVQNSWRSFLTYAALGSGEMGAATIAQLEAESQRISRTMEAVRSRRFLATIEDERSKIADEYRQNPDALKRRLGVPISAPSAPPVISGRSRQSLGELAVRTAVRATVWETIITIFRAFR